METVRSQALKMVSHLLNELAVVLKLAAKTCSNEGLEERAIFCCGSQCEDSECFAGSATLLRLLCLPTDGSDNQRSGLGALNINLLPILETPLICSLNLLIKSSEHTLQHQSSSRLHQQVAA